MKLDTTGRSLRVAIASYDGPMASGRTHLVQLGDRLAATACRDGWNIARASIHKLPALITCDACRAELHTGRVFLHADDLQRLIGAEGLEVVQ